MAEQTSCWRVVEDALGAGLKRLLLYGPSGTRETFASLTKGEPTMSRRLLCIEDLTSRNMLGTWMPNRPDRWGFHEGPAVQAWREVSSERGRLVVNEVDDEWFEDGASMFAFARPREVFPDRSRLEPSCVDNCAEKAIFNMASFGKGQLDAELIWGESL